MLGQHATLASAIQLWLMHADMTVQAIGAEGVIAAQCRSLVKAYLPQLIKIIATMPSDQVCRCAALCCAVLCCTGSVYYDVAVYITMWQRISRCGSVYHCAAVYIRCGLPSKWIAVRLCLQGFAVPHYSRVVLAWCNHICFQGVCVDKLPPLFAVVGFCHQDISSSLPHMMRMSTLS